MTLHRPALVDGPLLATVLRELIALAGHMTVIFPVHPRTRAAIEAQEIAPAGRLRLLEPLGYIEFLSLLTDAAGALTDSGGLQEETTYLGVPCFTLRDTTERPITVESGTNTLLGLAPERIAQVPRLLALATPSAAQVPPLWDGMAAERIVDVLAEGGESRAERSRAGARPA